MTSLLSPPHQGYCSDLSTPSSPSSFPLYQMLPEGICGTSHPLSCGSHHHLSPQCQTLMTHPRPNTQWVSVTYRTCSRARHRQGTSLSRKARNLTLVSLSQLWSRPHFLQNWVKWFSVIINHNGLAPKKSLKAGHTSALPHPWETTWDLGPNRHGCNMST